MINFGFLLLRTLDPRNMSLKRKTKVLQEKKKSSSELQKPGEHTGGPMGWGGGSRSAGAARESGNIRTGYLCSLE